jgi:large subunit ribosomal protein L11
MNILKLTIPAGEAKMAPPLGVVFGQHQLPGAKICLDFNKQSSSVLIGVPLKVEIKKVGQAGFELQVKTPPLPFLIIQQLDSQSNFEVTLEALFDVFRFCKSLPEFGSVSDVVLAKAIFSTLKSTRCRFIKL